MGETHNVVRDWQRQLQQYRSDGGVDMPAEALRIGLQSFDANELCLYWRAPELLHSLHKTEQQQSPLALNVRRYLWPWLVEHIDWQSQSATVVPNDIVYPKALLPEDVSQPPTTIAMPLIGHDNNIAGVIVSQHELHSLQDPSATERLSGSLSLLGHVVQALCRAELDATTGLLQQDAFFRRVHQWMREESEVHGTLLLLQLTSALDIHSQYGESRAQASLQNVLGFLGIRLRQRDLAGALDPYTLAVVLKKCSVENARKVELELRSLLEQYNDVCDDNIVDPQFRTAFAKLGGPLSMGKLIARVEQMQHESLMTVAMLPTNVNTPVAPISTPKLVAVKSAPAKKLPDNVVDLASHRRSVAQHNKLETDDDACSKLANKTASVESVFSGTDEAVAFEPQVRIASAIEIQNPANHVLYFARVLSVTPRDSESGNTVNESNGIRPDAALRALVKPVLSSLAQADADANPTSLHSTQTEQRGQQVTTASAGLPIVLRLRSGGYSEAFSRWLNIACADADVPASRLCLHIDSPPANRMRDAIMLLRTWQHEGFGLMLRWQASEAACNIIMRRISVDYIELNAHQLIVAETTEQSCDALKAQIDQWHSTGMQVVCTGLDTAHLLARASRFGVDIGAGKVCGRSVALSPRFFSDS